MKWIEHFYIHWWLGIPEAIPGPLAAKQQPQPAKKAEPKQQPASNEWKDLDIEIGYGYNMNIVTLETNSKYNNEGFECDIRPKSVGGKKSVRPTLTDRDRVELSRRNVTQRAGERLKPIFAANPKISAGDLAKAGDYKMRTCESAIAAFRAALE